MSSKEDEKSDRKQTEVTTHCQICLFDTETQKDISFKNGTERLIVSTIKQMTKSSCCPTCKRWTHVSCSMAQSGKKSDFCECKGRKDNKHPTCIVCGCCDGGVKSYTHNGVCFSGHFLCLYMSNRFMLLDCDFVPLNNSLLEQDKSQKASVCSHCRNTIHELDNRFSCQCGVESHMYCVLREKVSGLASETYSDESVRPFPVFNLREFYKSTRTVPVSDSLVQSATQFANKITHQPQNAIQQDSVVPNKSDQTVNFSVFVTKFKLICLNCKNNATDSLYCCRKINQTYKHHLIGCSICTTWMHSMDPYCKSPEPSDVKLLEELDGQSHASHSSKHSVKNKRSQRSKTEKATADNDFWGCKYCINLAVKVKLWDKQKPGVMIGHECFVANLVLRQLILDYKFKSSSEMLKMCSFFSERFFLKMEALELFALQSKIAWQSVSVEKESEALGFTSVLSREGVKSERVEEVIAELKRVIKSRESDETKGESDKEVLSLKKLKEYLKSILGFIREDKTRHNNFNRLCKRINEEVLRKEGHLFDGRLHEFHNRVILGSVKRIGVVIGSHFQEDKARQEALAAIKLKQKLGTDDVVRFMEWKIPLAVYRNLEAEFRDNDFALAYLARQFRRNDYEQFPDFERFRNHDEFKLALERLLLSVFYDSSQSHKMSAFLTRFRIFTDLSFLKSKITKRISRTKSIETGKKFMSDFLENFKWLLGMKSLEHFFNLCSKHGYEATDMHTLYQKSVARNTQLEEQIRPIVYRVEENNLKGKVEELLDVIIREELAVSEKVLDFLKLHFHNWRCDLLLNVKQPITLQQFNDVFGKVLQTHTANNFTFELLKKQRERRAKLDQEVEGARKVELSVDNFDDFCEGFHQLQIAAAELNHKNEFIDNVEASRSFWQRLTNALDDSVECENKLSRENWEVIKRKIELCDSRRVDILYEKLSKEFVVPELGELARDIKRQYWTYQLKAITRSDVKAKMSLVLKLEQLTAEEALIVNEVLEKMDVSDRQKVERTKHRLSEAKREVREWFAGDLSDDLLLENPSVRVLWLDKQMKAMYSFQIDIDTYVQLYQILYFFRLKAETFKIMNKFNSDWNQKLDDSERLNPRVSSERGSASMKAKTTQSSLEKNRLGTFLNEEDFRIRAKEEPSIDRLASHRYSNDSIEDFDRYRSRLTSIQWVLKKNLFFPSDSSENLKAFVQNFNTNLAKFLKTVKKLDRLLSFSEGDSDSPVLFQIEESDVRFELSNFKSMSVLFKSRVKKAYELLDDFEIAKGALATALQAVLSVKIEFVRQKNKLTVIKRAMDMMNENRIKSERSRALIELADSLLQLFYFDEKTSELLSCRLKDVLEKSESAKLENCSREFLDDVEQYLKQLEIVEGELKSIQKKMVSEEDFKESVSRIVRFVQQATFPTSFNYDLYTDFVDEINSVWQLVSYCNNKPYIRFLRKSNTKIQLPVSIKKTISDLKTKACQVNDFVQAELDSLGLKERLILYRVLGQMEDGLSDFYNEETIAFYANFNNKRKDFEELDTSFTDSIRKGTSLEEVMRVNQLKRESCNSFLKEDKEKSLISEIEKIAFRLKRNHMLVEFGQACLNDKECPFDCLQFEETMKAIEAKIQKKTNAKKNSRYFQIVKKDALSLFFVHFQLIFAKNSSLVDSILESSTKMESYNECFEAFGEKFDEIKNNLESKRRVSFSESELRDLFALKNDPFIKKSSNSAVDFESSCLQNAVYTNQEVLLDVSRLISNEVIDFVEHVLSDKIKVVERKVFEGVPEKQKESQSLAKELFNEFMKVQMIMKDDSSRRKLEVLSFKLANWIENDSRSYKPLQFKAPQSGINDDCFGIGADSNLRKRSQPDKRNMSYVDANQFVGERSQTKLFATKSAGLSATKQEEVMKYLSKLNAKPTLCSELERHDFEFDFVLQSIDLKEDTYVAQKRSIFTNENSKQSQKSLMNLSYSQCPAQEEPFSGQLVNEEETVKSRNQQILETPSNAPLKKVKQQPIDSNSCADYTQSARVIVWGIRFLDISFKDVNMELEFMTSKDPLTFCSLKKATLFMKVEQFINMTRGTLQTHEASKRVIGTDRCIALLSSIIESIKTNKESREALFGGWFQFPKNAVLENKESKEFFDLLCFIRDQKCFVEETLSMANHLRKIYIGSARFLNTTIENWLKVMIRKSEKQVSVDDVWVFFIHNLGHFTTEGEANMTSLSELVTPIITMDEEEYPQFAQLSGWRGDDPLVVELRMKQLDLLEENKI